jgi:UDP-N-acetylglucosamine 2-epimerase (non-hydrolysing)
MHVLTVVGARPQFIKAYPVSRALREHHDETLVHTGQHYDELLSDVFFEELDLPTPDYHLDVGSAPHAKQQATMMRRLDDVFADEEPDTVLVYGDTNSTLAAALVAAKRDPSVVHVEAGLRSNNWEMPEEINRVLTDHCSDVCCAPSERAVETLRTEGITEGVFMTGDVMYDAVLAVRDRARERSTVLSELGVEPGEFVLATVHRAANTDDPNRLRSIVDGLVETSRPVVLPAHPRTIAALREHDLYERADEGVHLCDPLGYFEFIRLVETAHRVATDSGGVQKEAFYLETPCVTLRDETEWTETLHCGWNALVGADTDAIVQALEAPFETTEHPPVYGDGNAAARVVDAISELDSDVRSGPPASQTR